MAAAVALSIPELLETILLLVDPRTVLLSQRVNKSFQATIRGSEKLQVKLFFRQSDLPSVNPLKGVKSHNSLLLKPNGPAHSPRWALDRSAHDLPSESSALDMYPCSLTGQIYWGELISLKLREGDRPQKWFSDGEDETLHQYLRGLAWTRKSRRELNWTKHGVKKNRAVRIGGQGAMNVSGGSRSRRPGHRV